MSKSTLDILRAGRAWLAEDPQRWSPNGFGAFPETACAVGALRAGGCGIYSPAHRALLDAVQPEGFVSIMAFNDVGAGTVDDVLRVYDRAIAAELAKQRSTNPEVPQTAERVDKRNVPQATPRRRDPVGCERERVAA